MSGQPTRFYGLALGKEKNFQAVTDGLATESDATPSIATKSLLYTNNTTATVITAFDDAVEGQLLTLVILDSNTSIARSATMLVSNTSEVVGGGGEVVNLIYHNGIWYETSKGNSKLNSNFYEIVSLATNNSALTVSNDNRVMTLLCTSGGVNLSFLAISGGYAGQEIYLTNYSDGKTVKLNTAGNIMLSGTNALIVDDSMLVHLINGGNGYWYVPRGTFVG